MRLTCCVALLLFQSGCQKGEEQKPAVDYSTTRAALKALEQESLAKSDNLEDLGMLGKSYRDVLDAFALDDIRQSDPNSISVSEPLRAGMNARGAKYQFSYGRCYSATAIRGFPTQAEADQLFDYWVELIKGQGLRQTTGKKNLRRFVSSDGGLVVKIERQGYAVPSKTGGDLWALTLEMSKQ